jgi:hypothetical protein
MHGKRQSSSDGTHVVQAAMRIMFSADYMLLCRALGLLIQSLSKPIATKLRRLRSIGVSG